MIRVVAYNLSGGLEARALSDVLSATNADIVCAVEAPGRLALRRVARRAGLTVACRAGRRRGSVAILVGDRVRVVSASEDLLEAPRGLPPRPVGQAIVAVRAVRLGVVVVQLGLRPELRHQHAGEVLTIVGKLSAPAIVGADLNEGPAGPAAVRLATALQDGFAVAGDGPGETFPNPEPLARQTFVLADRALAVQRVWVPSGAVVRVASHHRPVVAEVAEPQQVPSGESLGARRDDGEVAA